MKRKRCKAASPGLGWRCEKKRKHTGFHRAEWAEWSPEEGSTWTGPQAEHAEERLGHEVTTVTVDEVGPYAAANELRDWWLTKAVDETDQTVAKAIEYGSTDLIDIGQSIARAAGREALDEDEAAEWGIFFYLEGKLSRWRSAIAQGRRPSHDTLLDIGVYARMAQRIRDTGGWPGTPADPFHPMCTEPCGKDCK